MCDGTTRAQMGRLAGVPIVIDNGHLLILTRCD